MKIRGTLKTLGVVMSVVCLFAVKARCEDPKRLATVQKVCAEAVMKWEEKSGWQFTIPFPKSWDIDYWNKLPIASVLVFQKVHCTRPAVVQATDHCTISFILCPGEMSEFGKRSMDCMMTVDKRGEFVSTVLLLDPDRWTEQNSGTQIRREVGENTDKYVERIIATYRERAKNAKNPAEADRLLTVYEKMIRGIAANLCTTTGN